MILNKSKVYSIKNYKDKDINLLPPELTRVNRTRLLTIVAALLCSVVVVVFAIYEFSLYNKTNDYKTNTLNMQGDIQENNQRIENQNIIISLGERIKRKDMLLTYISDSNRSIIDILLTFESQLNVEIYLSALTANSEESLSIIGSSTSHEGVSELINQLKFLTWVDTLEDGTQVEISYFEDVFLSSMTLEIDENDVEYQVFELHCKFQGGVTND